MSSTNGSRTGEMPPKTDGSLVGKWFHTTTTCECPCHARVAAWQGQIISEPGPGIYLIELYEWFVGQPSGQEFITLADFMARNPVLYDTNEDMRFSYHHGALAHSRRCDGGQHDE